MVGIKSRRELNAEIDDLKTKNYALTIAATDRLSSMQDESIRLRELLKRALNSVEGGKWRDKAGLSAEAHPVWDDVREVLR